MHYCAKCQKVSLSNPNGKYCERCREQNLQARQAELDRLWQEAQLKRKVLLVAEFGTSRLKVFEYDGQELAMAGLYNVPGHAPIRRICADCRQDDQHIRGNWAPVFEDGRGHLTLLCWPCYDQRCKKAD